MPTGPRGSLEAAARRVYRRLPIAGQQRVRRLRERLSIVDDLRRQVSPPALSVIMPVYNVRIYLDEAVESVLNQDFRDLELILVDDGSTDESGTMCDVWAARDDRVRVIHKKNDGLGAARNTGIAAARGKFLIFIDSDDYVPDGVYGRMMKAARRNGADIVTGNVQRLHGQRVYLAWNQSRTHNRDRFGVTLADDPNLVYDTVSWNKLYRADFFREHVHGFPEHKLYEDMHPVFRALAAARTIDILSEPVYVWRRRDEGDSITQRLLETTNLSDRMEMLGAIESTLAEEGTFPAVGPSLLYKILEGDLWIYVSTLLNRGGASDDFVELLVANVRHYWREAPEEARSPLPPERCVVYALIDDGRLDDANTFWRWYHENRRQMAVDVSPDGVVSLDLADCPVPVPPLRDGDLEASGLAVTTSVLTYGGWRDGTTFWLTGYAYNRFVSTGTQQITLVATDAETGAQHEWPTERVDSPEVAAGAYDAVSGHEHDGFVVEFDVADLPGERATWEFGLRVEDGPLVRTVLLDTRLHTGSLSVVPSRVVRPGVLAIVRTTRNIPFTVEFQATPVELAEFASDGPDIHARPVDGTDPGVRLWLARRGGGERVELKRDPDGGYRGRVPLDVAFDGADQLRPVSWRLMSAVGDGSPATVLAPQQAVGNRPDRDGVRLEVNRSGRALVTVYPATAVVDDVAVDGDTVTLGGVLLRSDRGEFGLGGAQSRPDDWVSAEVVDGRFRVTLPLTTADADGTERARPSGDRHVYFLPASGEPNDVLVTDGCAGTLPLAGFGHLTSARIARRGGGGLRVEIASPLDPADRGNFAQRNFIREYGRPDRDLADAVLFYVNIGAGASDSALAIHEELRRRDAGLELLWGVTDLSVPVPEGGRPILKYSREWFEKVNTSRYIVNNYGGINGLVKHPDQRYLQTWHGTPYKHVGASEMRARPDAVDRLAAAAREAAEWDAFVSPNPFMSEIVPTEFLFDGTVLETGYPRNDALANATAAQRSAIRARLGIRDDARVLLYAPTYREKQRSGWQAKLYQGLDLEHLVKLLGPEWTIILRGHSFVARGDHADRTGPQIVDATREPDINELYIASDALLTDYSSAMFDYAVTGRPILLFVPDLEEYVASRGVYFDLAEMSPSPLFTEVGPLAAALCDLEAFAAESVDRYTAFRARFAPWDDGHATERVLDAFFIV